MDFKQKLFQNFYGLTQLVDFAIKQYAFWHVYG